MFNVISLYLLMAVAGGASTSVTKLDQFKFPQHCEDAKAQLEKVKERYVQYVCVKADVYR